MPESSATQMRFSLGLLVATLVSGCASPVPITGVSVRDDEFQVVKVLAPAELAEFQRQWEEMVTVEVALPDAGGRHFKLDIDHRIAGGRWLYQTTGYVQLLSKAETPVYKVPNPVAFNRLIRATK